MAAGFSQSKQSEREPGRSMNASNPEKNPRASAKGFGLALYEADVENAEEKTHRKQGLLIQ